MLFQKMLKKVGKIEEGKTGAALGALAGFTLIPYPGGLIAGAIAGSAAQNAIKKWMLKNKEKLQAFCSKKGKVGSPEYSTCMAAGHSAMKAELQKAKK